MASHARIHDQIDQEHDLVGAVRAAADLRRALAAHDRSTAAGASDRQVLAPPLDPSCDRIVGLPAAAALVVVFGDFDAPGRRRLGRVLAQLRARWAGSVRIAWRHFPVWDAHPRAATLALAAEAAADRGRFWAFTLDLLARSHNDPEDVDAAFVAAGLDPGEMLSAMRAGVGHDRIIRDVDSGIASGVDGAPALFLNGVRYRGRLAAADVERTLGLLP
jgi:protein-disulfide isomerase